MLEREIQALRRMGKAHQIANASDESPRLYAWGASWSANGWFVESGFFVSSDLDYLKARVRARGGSIADSIFVLLGLTEEIPVNWESCGRTGIIGRVSAVPVRYACVPLREKL